jgi:hypothetical protein
MLRLSGRGQRKAMSGGEGTLDERTRWFYSERAAERAALAQSEHPVPPIGWYDQFGDWHEGWFAYPQDAKDVESRLRASSEGEKVPAEDSFLDE